MMSVFMRKLDVVKYNKNLFHSGLRGQKQIVEKWNNVQKWVEMLWPLR